MKNKSVCGKYFCGNEISRYGQEQGYVDYATLSRAFDAVLNNTIWEKGWQLGEWEMVNGWPEEDDGYDQEVYQWYIVSDGGAELLQDWTDEILYYHEELDIYLWGVTHWGTSWDYVLTDIRCNAGYEGMEG